MNAYTDVRVLDAEIIDEQIITSNVVIVTRNKFMLSVEVTVVVDIAGKKYTAHKFIDLKAKAAA